MGMGVRAAAMGKAFSAVADDALVVYYNPAGLGQIKSGQMGIEYTRWFEDVGYTGVNGVYPFKTMGIGGFANMLFTDEMKITTNEKPQGTGKTFRETNGIFGVSGGINLTNHISVGATGKICSQQIGTDGAVGVAGDLGFLCKTEHVGLGLVFQNIGTKMRFIDTGFALPTTIRTGLAWTTPSLTISGELAGILPEKKMVARVGFEGWLLNTIALRCGYEAEDGHGPTAGFGIKTQDSASLQIDYAYVPYEKFDATHRLSVSVRFGNRTVPKLSTEKIPAIIPEAEKTTQETAPYLDSNKKVSPLSPRSNNAIPQQLEPVSTPSTAATPSPIPVALPKPPDPVIQKQAAQTPVSSNRQPPKQIKTVTIIVDNTPIFSGPGRTYPVITIVPDGVELILVDNSKKWYYQVKLPDGSLGWVSYANCQE